MDRRVRDMSVTGPEAMDGIKPVGPVWPGRPLRELDRKEERREPPRRDREPVPPRKDDDSDGPKIDEYARMEPRR